MAVDNQTGAIAWQSANKDDAGYSTPLPFKAR
jgi:hypothetical protein